MAIDLHRMYFDDGKKENVLSLMIIQFHPLSTIRTTNSHLRSFNTKPLWHMPMEIQKHQNVAGLNNLMGCDIALS
jgi:hypothetical protein